MLKYLPFLVILFYSCGPENNADEYLTRNITEYSIVPDALQDREMVRVIYSPGMPDKNDSITYFVNLIVVSEKTNDTVNLLTTSLFDLSEGNNKRNYFSPKSNTFKFYYSSILKLDNINDFDVNSIRKVMVSKQSVDYEENDYPCVFGVLGTFTETGATEVNDLWREGEQ